MVFMKNTVYSKQFGSVKLFSVLLFQYLQCTALARTPSLDQRHTFLMMFDLHTSRVHLMHSLGWPLTTMGKEQVLL